MAPYGKTVDRIRLNAYEMLVRETATCPLYGLFSTEQLTQSGGNNRHFNAGL